MKKALLIIMVILMLMFAEYRFIMRNIKPQLVDDGFLCIDLFGSVDWYDINE